MFIVSFFPHATQGCVETFPLMSSVFNLCVKDCLRWQRCCHEQNQGTKIQISFLHCQLLLAEMKGMMGILIVDVITAYK